MIATHTEALLWLNDHQTKWATVSVEFDTGEDTVALIEHEGKLVHWSRDDRVAPAALAGALARAGDELTGWYRIGEDGVSVDLTDLADAGVTFEIGEDDLGGDAFSELVVALDRRTTLRITIAA